jgi:hypothetical protein
MHKSDSIDKLAAAIAEMQATGLVVIKDKVNPFFKSQYADLASVWDAIRVPMAENGLAVVQGHEVGADGTIVLNTVLLHTSGQFIEYSVPLVLSKADPQGVAAATTYMRRSALSAIVGLVADDDDDGNSVSHQPQQQQQQQQRPPTPPPAARPASQQQQPSGGAPRQPAPLVLPPTPPQANEQIIGRADPFGYTPKYISKDIVNWLRENVDPTKLSTEKQAGYATGILKAAAKIGPKFGMTYEGEDYNYSGVDVLMLLLLGRTFDGMPHDFAQWVFKYLNDTRSVVGPDGRFVAGQRESNPDYDPALFMALAPEFAAYCEYMQA